LRNDLTSSISQEEAWFALFAFVMAFYEDVAIRNIIRETSGSLFVEVLRTAETLIGVLTISRAMGY
jgi:hypothetical protein